MQVLKSDPSPYSKVFLVKGKGGNPASRRELAKAEFEVVVFVCVLFFSRLVFCVWLSFVLFSLSSSSLLWFLSVWLFAFVAPPTIVSAHVGILFPPRSLSFAYSLADLSSRFSFFASPSRISDHRSLARLSFNFLPFRFLFFTFAFSWFWTFVFSWLSDLQVSSFVTFRLFNFWTFSIFHFLTFAIFIFLFVDFWFSLLLNVRALSFLDFRTFRFLDF